MIDIILYVVIGILVLVCTILFILLRGAMRTDTTENSIQEIRPLTGKEIERIRRKLILAGSSALAITEVFCLISTIREIQLGRYADDDPWIPPDIYEDIDTKVVDI